MEHTKQYKKIKFMNCSGGSLKQAQSINDIPA